MYGTKKAERPFVEEWMKNTGNEVKMVEKQLDDQTVELAKDCVGVSIQQTAALGDANLYAKLAEYGIKQISTRTAGFDMIDLQACKENGITVTNVAVYSPRAIAEMGVTHAMYLLRRIGEFQTRMAQGDFTWNADLISNEIYNQTVGVIGLGNIGGATAQIYKALGAKVLAYDPNENVEYAPFVEYTDFDTVIKQSDIITLHTPLLPSTANMITASQFTMMKKNAILINMARGGLVDTTDLITALKNRQIAAAGLDTLADETTYFGKEVSLDQVPNDYKELSQMDNVLITPHVAFFTQTAIRNMVAISLNDVVKIVEGQHSKDEVRG